MMVHCNLTIASLRLHKLDQLLGYEPADLTVHPIPPRTVHSFVSVPRVSPKNVLKGKPVLFGVIRVKRPKNVFFQHIHSDTI